MSNTYNIYKVESTKVGPLKAKLGQIGLVEQKTIKAENFSLTFYFSERVDGNEIWWWQTYRDFFNDGIVEPKNIFYFGLLLCCDLTGPEIIYAVSLGKSHFYLSKFIQPDFGINLAVRMADENTILLKKSRHFAGTKRQEVASYENFQMGTYEPGESVEHLKVKASDRKLWGGRNIIFADSIQMDVNKSPIEMVEIFDQIGVAIGDEPVLQLPKLEKVEGDLLGELDKLLFDSLKNAEGKVKVEEFTTYGVAICFSFHDYDYRLSAKPEGQAQNFRMNVGNGFDVSDIRDFLSQHPQVIDINTVRIQFKNDDASSFTKPLKDILDLPIDYGDAHYFLRHGDWYRFNDTFLDYLRRSLESIEIIERPELDEADYLSWKAVKEKAIAAGADVDDKLLYRESYFNKKQCTDYGYLLLDRQLEQIKSMQTGKKDYRVEVADLYKDGEIVSVKISEANHELIYNIEQSKDAIELIKRHEIDFEHELRGAALWFVFENKIDKITDVNSIQFLLAVESWRKLAVNFNLMPRIYISRHKLAP
ncbi:MAG: DUF6119 family protein [Telluria sp.]